MKTSAYRLDNFLKDYFNPEGNSDINPIEIVNEAINVCDEIEARINKFGSDELNDQFAEYKRMYVREIKGMVFMATLEKRGMNVPRKIADYYQNTFQEFEEYQKTLFPLLEREVEKRKASRA